MAIEANIWVKILGVDVSMNFYTNLKFTMVRRALNFHSIVKLKIRSKSSYKYLSDNFLL